MIDERKLIEGISKEWEELVECSENYETLLEYVVKFIKKQPKIGDWIPCSERLPEEIGWYIATCVHEGNIGTVHELYYNGKGWNLESIISPCAVVAWQYKPEAYHEKEKL